MDPIAAFSSDRGETFTLRTVDDAPAQDLMPASVAWGPDPQGAGFTWMSFEHSLLNGDRNVRFRPLSASEPDVAVLEVTPVQAAKDAARLAAGRATTIRVKLRSAAPARARVPLEIELAYDDEDRERVERTIEQDVTLRPGVSTVQLLADDPVVVGAGRITAKVKVSHDLPSDSDHSNDEGEGSRAVVEPRPLTVLFVPVAAGDEARPACADVQAVADGFEEHMLASWPVNPRYSHVLTDCSALMVHDPELTDAGLMGARGLLARLDRLKWTGLMIDKVVGVTPRGWFSRQAMPGLAQAVGAAPLGGTLDAALVERQNTGGWVVAHELAHQLGWTEEPGQHGNHLDEVPAPGYWVDERRDIPETTRDFMHFSTDGADVRKTTDRWISRPTWDFLTTKLASPVMGATAEQGLAAAQQRTLSLTGTVKADGSVVAGDMAEVEGEPDAGEGEGPLTFEQLAADGSVLQTRRFGISSDMGPIGGDSATGDEHAVTADAAFSLRVPAVDGARSLRIRRGADVLLERARPAAAPTVDVTAPTAGAKVGIGADMTITLERRGRRRRCAHALRRALHGRRRDLELARRRAHRRLADREGVARPRRQRRARPRDHHRRLEHRHRRLRAVQHRRPALRRQDRLQRLGQRRHLDRRHRRRQREEDRRPRPPPALVAGRHQARLGLHGPLHGRTPTAATSARSPGERQDLLGPMWADDDTLLAKLENSYPKGNQVVEIGSGAATDFGTTSASKFAVLCDVSADGSKMLAPQRPLRGLLVDVHRRRRQDRRAARGQVLRLAVARRPLRGRHEVPQRQRLADRRDRRRPQDRRQDQPHQRHLRRLQRLPELVADRRVDHLGLQQGAQRRDRLRRDGPVADPPGRHRRAEDRRRQGARQKNFEPPDIQPLRGFEPDPEPTRQELKPVAERRRPVTGAEGATVALDARGSKPGAGGEAIAAYAWDLDGDGAYDDATARSRTTTFPDEGTYAVAVQVTDAAGRVATATAEVTIANAAPAISGARVNDADPASFTATVTDAGVQDVQTATIDWGDGAPAETVPVVAGTPGLPRGRLARGARRHGEADRARRGRRRSDRDRDARARARQQGARRGRRGRDGAPERDRRHRPARLRPRGRPARLRDRRPARARRALDARARPAGARAARGDLRRRRRVHGRGHVHLPGLRRHGQLAHGDRHGRRSRAARRRGRPGRRARARAPAGRGARRARAARPRPRGHQAGRPGRRRGGDERAEGEQGAAPRAAQILTLPSSKRCVSRRKFRIRVKRIKGQGAYKRVEVSVDGKRTKVVRSVRDTATVDLRGLPKGRFKVRITVTLADGRKVSSTRRYRTCAKRPSTPKKKGARL